MKTYIIDGQLYKSHFDEIQKERNKSCKEKLEEACAIDPWSYLGKKEIEKVSVKESKYKFNKENIEDMLWDQYLARNDKN